MKFILLFIIPLFLAISCTEKSVEDSNANSTEQNPANEPGFGYDADKEMVKIQGNQPKENPYKDATVEIITFKDSLGWGYDVYINKSQYVHQPHIPAVSGNRGFSNENFAKKTGEFVAFKIKNNIMPPSITPGELDSLGVLH